MQIGIFQGEVNLLKQIAQTWEKEIKNNDFLLDSDVESHLEDLRRLIEGKDSDLIVMHNNDIPVGYMGITIFKSPISNQLIANEHYWYVIPEYRGVGSLRFIKYARQWAKMKGCSHLIMNASNLASELHDRVCKIYEKFDMKKFETSYIEVL